MTKATADQNFSLGNADATGKRRRGGQPGNLNGLRHGLYSPKAGEVSSAYGQGQVNLFRRAIEAAVLERHGEISVYHAALVQTAVEATRCAVANRELLAGLADPRPELRLQMDKAYLDNLHRRDEKLKMLELDRSIASGPSGGKADSLTDFEVENFFGQSATEADALPGV